MDRESIGEVRMQPAHVWRATLRAWPPAMVHRGDAVYSVPPATYRDLADDPASLIEMAVVSRSPREFTFQRLRGHDRIHFRIMDIVGFHQRVVFDVNFGTVSV